MFGSPRRRPPIIIPLLIAVAFGYLLAGGAGSLVGAVLFLPLLLMKMVFMFFLFGMLLRFAGGGRPWAHNRADHQHRGSTESQEETKAKAEEKKDWEEALRSAKREIDKLFPNPRE